MLNGVRSLRRYRLVIAQKSKLRLTQEVTAALVSHSREHRLTASGFFRAQLIGSTCMCTRLCGCVFPTMDLQSSSFFFCRRPLPFGGSHLRLPSGPAGVRTTTGSLSALARPTPYQLSHRSPGSPVLVHPVLSTSSEAARYIYILGWD